MNVDLRHGDCLEVLRTLPDCSVDAVVTDPPYGLSFMGKRWDYDVPSVEVWAECLRVLKPGGHLLAFAGTRTQHRMAVRIEDAGFEIRDMIAWVYGSGFPKSHNLDGDRKGWGTALKPALEPITVARKPLDGTVAENVLRHGTGAINVDACRIPSGDGRTGDGSTGDNGRGQTGGQRSRTGCTSGLAGHSPQPAPSSGLLASVPGCENQRTQPQDSPGDCPPCPRCGGVPVRPSQADGQASSQQPRDERELLCRCAIEPDNRERLSTYGKDTARHVESQGRWPANLIHDGSDEVVRLFPQTVASKSAVGVTRNGRSGGIMGKVGAQRDGRPEGHNDTGGSAARFFYCAKASKADRDDGCEGLEERTKKVSVIQTAGVGLHGQSENGKQIALARNHHPTVKPTALMRYLCRLVTPPGGIVLDPFMGSGSTGKGAVLEGFRFLGIEREAEYLTIARARIASAEADAAAPRQAELFQEAEA